MPSPGPTTPAVEPRAAYLVITLDRRDSSRLWGWALVGLGGLLLLSNLGVHVAALIGKLWPIGLILFGAWLIRQYMQSSREP